MFWKYRASLRCSGRFKGKLSAKHKLGQGFWTQYRGRLQKGTAGVTSRKSGLCQDSLLLFLDQVRLR